MKTLKLLLVIVVFCFSAIGCSQKASKISEADVQLVIGESVSIPEGYELIEASAYGQFDNNLTFYLQQKASGRVFEYKNNKIGKEIILPEGYRLKAVSSYGKWDNNRTFYCQKKETDQIFICSPK